MEKFIDNDYTSVFEKNGILNLYFKAKTKFYTDEDFKTNALSYIDIVKKYNSKRIIVDMRELFFTLSPELINWRNKNIVAEYNRIGVEKFAFINDEVSVNQDSPENTFITKYFQSKKEAEDWIKS